MQLSGWAYDKHQLKAYIPRFIILPCKFESCISKIYCLSYTQLHKTKFWHDRYWGYQDSLLLIYFFFHEKNSKHLKHKQKHLSNFHQNNKLKNMNKSIQVAFTKTVNLKNINKSISSNFHLDNMLKKLSSK